MSPRSGWCASTGSTRRHRWCGPRACVPHDRVRSRLGRCRPRTAPRLAMPALLTRMSTGPKLGDDLVHHGLLVVGRRVDAGLQAIARRPSFSISVTVSAAASASRAVVHRDVGAVLGQCQADRPADAPPTTGDQGHTSFQLTHAANLDCPRATSVLALRHDRGSARGRRPRRLVVRRREPAPDLPVPDLCPRQHPGDRGQAARGVVGDLGGGDAAVERGALLEHTAERLDHGAEAGFVHRLPVRRRRRLARCSRPSACRPGR